MPTPSSRPKISFRDELDNEFAHLSHKCPPVYAESHVLDEISVVGEVELKDFMWKLARWDGQLLSISICGVRVDALGAERLLSLRPQT